MGTAIGVIFDASVIVGVPSSPLDGVVWEERKKRDGGGKLRSLTFV